METLGEINTAEPGATAVVFLCKSDLGVQQKVINADRWLKAGEQSEQARCWI